MSEVIVGRLPLYFYGILFLFYLITHTVIGINLNKTKKLNDEKPGNKEIEDKYKSLTLLFKWFPSFYIVLIILFLYII